MGLKARGLKIHSQRRKIKRTEKNEDHPWDMENYFKRPNLRIMGSQEGVEQEQRVESPFKEIITEDFPKLEKDTNILILEGCGIPNRLKSNMTTPRYLIIKLSKAKDKEKILKATKQ